MRFETWEPVYETILADFGFDRTADERVRDVLAGLAEPFDLARLDVADETRSEERRVGKECRL